MFSITPSSIPESLPLYSPVPEDKPPFLRYQTRSKAKKSKTTKLVLTWTLPKFVWSHISGRRTPPTTTGHIVEGFAQNLNELKRLSKIWAQNKRRRDDQTLREVEIEIVDFESNLGGLYNSNEHKDRISSQYADRGEILKDSEESWRLRSRAIWMLEGDDNTKFYHKFANGRKAINTIWKLPNEQGQPLNTFPQLAALASSHFKQIYRAPPIVNLAEIIHVAQLFPRFVDQEGGRELTKEVTLGEMEATLK
eukprot:PITA_16547